jgi:hypothetical protein
VIGAGGASAAVTPVPLGTAGSFVVLAGDGVAATGPNTLNGDLGTFPNTAITGAGSITVTGTNHGGDLVTQGAKNDLITAYDVAAGEGPTSPIAADLASPVLTQGIYNSASTVELSGALTLDAEGNPDALFVFQSGSDLIIGPGASVVLVNGAQACNVFWQVTSSASLDSGAAFKGTILALTSITLNTGATVEGRLLARNGNVTLDTNTITAPLCTTGGGSGGSGGGGGTDTGVSGGVFAAPSGGVSTGDGSGAPASHGAEGSLPVVIGVGVLAGLTVLAFSTRRPSHKA